MTLQIWIIVLAIGALSGWLAGKIVQGSGLGLIGDIIVGIAGSFVGSFVLPRLGIHLTPGILGQIINAAIGGIIVLILLSFIHRR